MRNNGLWSLLRTIRTPISNLISSKSGGRGAKTLDVDSKGNLPANQSVWGIAEDSCELEFAFLLELNSVLFFTVDGRTEVDSIARAALPHNSSARHIAIQKTRKRSGAGDLRPAAFIFSTITRPLARDYAGDAESRCTVFR